ncbi:MAG: MBOAT family O-acyltransferase [Bilifractor sp.]|jgi:alginate O-acetyltransferase complex protein AlgI
MIFSSIFFIFVFLPVTLLVYFLVPKVLKNFVLLICSLVFYAWGEPIYILLMIFSIFYNYISGVEMEFYRSRNQTAKLKFIFWLAVGVNLGILGFFKYYGFILDNLNHILPVDIKYTSLPLPIGISFYTFQTLSYIIDVYRGKVEVQKNLINFGLYISMFPQLIAGPIVRYADIEKQLTDRTVTMEGFGEGVMFFLKGLGKKVLLANNIGMAYTAVSELPAEKFSALAAWIGAIAYTFQIYFDFSGYSDMAIGLGKMFGFSFMKNFDHPYISASITEFWRRWHISLSSWFKEYVYIPLGGNRVSVAKHIRNIFIVWILTGFWHGAAWNFVFWGLYYGVLLTLEKYVLAPVLDRMPEIVRHLYALFFIVIGWVFFSSSSLPAAFHYLAVMFGGGSAVNASAGLYYLYNYIILFIICVICSGPGFTRELNRFIVSKKKHRRVIAYCLYIASFVCCIAFLVNATYNPFLYFRF